MSTQEYIAKANISFAIGQMRWRLTELSRAIHPPASYEQLVDNKLSKGSILEHIHSIRDSPYFRCIVKHNSTHDQFLYDWEVLEAFCERWEGPYKRLNQEEWEKERMALEANIKELGHPDVI